MAKNHLTVVWETEQPPIGKETIYYYARPISFIDFMPELFTSFFISNPQAYIIYAPNPKGSKYFL